MKPLNVLFESKMRYQMERTREQTDVKAVGCAKKLEKVASLAAGLKILLVESYQTRRIGPKLCLSTVEGKPGQMRD